MRIDDRAGAMHRLRVDRDRPGLHRNSGDIGGDEKVAALDRSGRGVGLDANIENIQALNTGAPSVSTRIGAEGLPIVHGEHVLITDDPARFAKHIEQPGHDRDIWERLASAGRTTIDRTHGCSYGKARFASILDRLIA
jgi:hypothetical protein